MSNMCWRWLPLFIVCSAYSWVGCSSEKISHGPPEDFIAYDLHAEPIAANASQGTEIHVGQPFDLVCTFYSAQPVRSKVLIKFLSLRADNRPTVMDSAVAIVSAGEANRYECRGDIQAMKRAGTYVAQVVYGGKVVDEATIAVVPKDAAAGP